MGFDGDYVVTKKATARDPNQPTVAQGSPSRNVSFPGLTPNGASAPE